MALSCQTHTAYIYDRGGMVRVGMIDPVSRVQWGRERNDISVATLSTVTPSAECCRMLGSVEAGRHELVIYRGSDRVWEGPITRMTHRRASVEIHARDVWHYPYRTILRRGYNDAGFARPVEQRAAAMMRAELARKEAIDPPVNVLPYMRVYGPSVSRQTRETLPYEKTLWEEIDSMASYSGLDYTAVGRAVVLSYTRDAALGRTSTVTGADFLGDVEITSYGMELATFAAATDGEGHFGWAGGTDPYYGLVEVLRTVREEGTNAEDGVDRDSLIDAAKAALGGRRPTPATLNVPANSTLDPATALTIHDLVPGVRIPVRAELACRTLVQEQRLDRVQVTEDAAGETIQVSMSPAPGEVAIIDGQGSDQG